MIHDVIFAKTNAYLIFESCERSCRTVLPLCPKKSRWPTGGKEDFPVSDPGSDPARLIFQIIILWFELFIIIANVLNSDWLCMWRLRFMNIYLLIPPPQKEQVKTTHSCLATQELPVVQWLKSALLGLWPGFDFKWVKIFFSFFTYTKIIFITVNHNFGPLIYWLFDELLRQSYICIQCVFLLMCLLTKTEILIITGNHTLGYYNSNYCMKYCNVI